MSLLILALTIFAIIIIWSTFWKILGLMVSLFIGLPYRWLMNQTTWGRFDREPSPFTPEDPSAIWIKGEKGTYFRYDLSTEGAEWGTQVDNLNAFYRKEGK